MPKFGEKSKSGVTEFIAEGKTPAGKAPLKVSVNDAQTPSQFKEVASVATLQSTDEQGNRISILPNSARPQKFSRSAASVASFKSKQ